MSMDVARSDLSPILTSFLTVTVGSQVGPIPLCPPQAVETTQAGPPYQPEDWGLPVYGPYRGGTLL